MGSVLRAEAPAKLVRGMPAYPVGMVLLARLAVDQSEPARGGCLRSASIRRLKSVIRRFASAMSLRGTSPVSFSIA
jgi:hypothetical protein